jgi:hypothetical protein
MTSAAKLEEEETPESTFLERVALASTSDVLSTRYGTAPMRLGLSDFDKAPDKQPAPEILAEITPSRPAQEILAPVTLAKTTCSRNSRCMELPRTPAAQEILGLSDSDEAPDKQPAPEILAGVTPSCPAQKILAPVTPAKTT